MGARDPASRRGRRTRSTGILLASKYRQPGTPKPVVERAKERWSAIAVRRTRLAGDMRPSVLMDLTGALERAASMSMAQTQALPSRCQCGKCGPKRRCSGIPSLFHSARWQLSLDRDEFRERVDLPYGTSLSKERGSKK